ncbi:MAG: DoxX family protein [Deltaproteobacteria bacterium]|nr:DoxX family protein [Deltaproteobacteria bacterium]
MKNVLGNWQSQTYALLRMVAGFMFMCHGLQKVFGILGGTRADFTSLGGAAGIIELVAGALILVGFQTSLAAFLSSGTMAVAYFIAHQGQGALPIQNGGELAVLYCFVFLFLAARGDGIWSLGGGKE